MGSTARFLRRRPSAPFPKELTDYLQKNRNLLPELKKVWTAAGGLSCSVGGSLRQERARPASDPPSARQPAVDPSGPPAPSCSTAADEIFMA